MSLARRFCRVLALNLLGLLAVPVSAHAEDISARAWVSQDSPYVRQTVIYTVRLYSSGSIRTIELIPPSVEGASLEELDGPVTGTQTVSGRRYVTNDFRFSLTPMKAGTIHIGAARFNVKPAESRWGGYQRPWQRPTPAASPSGPLEVSSDGVNIQVRPPAVQSPNWLPLEYLSIKAEWSDLNQAEVGQPLTLTVTIKGRGARGEQLPGVAGILEGTDWKVYPERPKTDWKLTGEGAYLWGRRVETYTLVPTREGTLGVPALSLPWWDVGAAQAKLAAEPTRLIMVGDLARTSGTDSVVGAPNINRRLMTRHALYYFALPVGGGLIIAFIVGWWIGAGQPPGVRFLRALGTVFKVVYVTVSQSIALVRRTFTWLVPSRLRGRVTRSVSGWYLYSKETLFALLMSVLPQKAKALWCIRCVDTEKDAAGLCQVLRRYACANLASSPNTSLQTIAEQLIDRHPRADASTMRQLFRELDDAVYGRRELDTKKWKRSFRRLFRKATRGNATPRSRQHHGLPELNPRT